MLLCWYLVFFSPFDIVAKIVGLLRLPFSMAQDLLRLHLTLQGVKMIAKAHPNALLYMFVIGFCKSSG